jgi:hypothetical protein
VNAPAKVDVLAEIDAAIGIIANDRGVPGDPPDPLAAARDLVADLITATRELVDARVAAHDPTLDRKAFAQARKRINLAEIAIAGVLARIAP